MTFTVDLYPNLRELGADELCAAPGLTLGGKPAYFYSACSPPHQIPRNRGEFLWRQANNAKMAGATALKMRCSTR